MEVGKIWLCFGEKMQSFYGIYKVDAIGIEIFTELTIAE